MGLDKEECPEFWELRLYVAGQTPKSIEAFSNLKKNLRNTFGGQISY